ncbi:hypothetical protein FRB97_008022 [Tulasnella sp. 331]|nr:hypothetical protein FRB97_008022 [Tulasnella sp. 331]
MRIFSLLSSKPTNPIAKQLAYRGPSCIPSDMADRKITDCSVLLQELNEIFDTSYTIQSTTSLQAVLNDCIERGYDFGMTYGMLRSWWTSTSNIASLLPTFERLERLDHEARQQAIASGMVTNPMMPPRRVWDLYSNRVLPIWVVEADPSILPQGFERIMRLHAISHAWMFPSQRQYLQTPINGFKWSVPLPKDVNLDDVRIELLNMRSEYVWLDVLCLRQKNGEAFEEALRLKEWELDVPTIGAVYIKCEHTIIYLNGLGLPFEESDLDSPRHWCNRAWTLQEWCLASSTSLGGVTPQSPKFRFHRHRLTADDQEESYSRLLRKRTDYGRAVSQYIFPAAAEMSKRSAESDLDKIAGLAFNFTWERHPAFYEQGTVDDAWSRFVLSTSHVVRGDLFFLFPTVGEGQFKWVPSWHQLLDGAQGLASRRPAVSLRLEPEFSPSADNVGGYTCRTILHPSCVLAGFGEKLDSTGSPRQGTISFETHCVVTLAAVANHGHLIPDGEYALLTNIGHYGNTCRYWIVGRWEDHGKRFKKITVLQLNDDEEIDKAGLYKALDLTIATSYLYRDPIGFVVDHPTPDDRKRFHALARTLAENRSLASLVQVYRDPDDLGEYRSTDVQDLWSEVDEIDKKPEALEIPQCVLAAMSGVTRADIWDHEMPFVRFCPFRDNLLELEIFIDDDWTEEQRNTMSLWLGEQRRIRQLIWHGSPTSHALIPHGAFPDLRSITCYTSIAPHFLRSRPIHTLRCDDPSLVDDTDGLTELVLLFSNHIRKLQLAIDVEDLCSTLRHLAKCTPDLRVLKLLIAGSVTSVLALRFDPRRFRPQPSAPALDTPPPQSQPSVRDVLQRWGKHCSHLEQVTLGCFTFHLKGEDFKQPMKPDVGALLHPVGLDTSFGTIFSASSVNLVLSFYEEDTQVYTWDSDDEDFAES